VLINADHHTAWNIRKRVLLANLEQHQQQGVDGLKQELKLLNLLFSKHPKSGESWAHRRWTLLQLIKTRQPVSDFVPEELAVCMRSTELYPKNYYAWTHRQWIVQKATNETLLLSELEVLKEWTDRHISDHCGFHHRQCVLLRLLGQCPGIGSELLGFITPINHSVSFLRVLLNAISSPENSPVLSSSSYSSAFSSTSSFPCAPSAATTTQKDPTEKQQTIGTVFDQVLRLWTQEFDYVSDLQDRYPGHEALWMHRRFLLSVQLRLLSLQVLYSAAYHAGPSNKPSHLQLRSLSQQEKLAVLRSWEETILSRVQVEINHTNTLKNVEPEENEEKDAFAREGMLQQRRFASSFLLWTVKNVFSLFGRSDPLPASPSFQVWLQQLKKAQKDVKLFLSENWGTQTSMWEEC